MDDGIGRTTRGAIVQWLIYLCFTLAKTPFLRRAKRKVFWKLIQCEPDDNFNSYRNGLKVHDLKGKENQDLRSYAFKTMKNPLTVRPHRKGQSP